MSNDGGGAGSATLLALPVPVWCNAAGRYGSLSAAKTGEEIREAIGVAGHWLIGVRALAAPLHHYILRDNTLRRIAPFVR